MVDRYWLLTTLTTIGVITLLGLALTRLVVPSRITGMFEALGAVLGFLANLLILIVAYPLFLILTPLIRALSGLFRIWMPEPGQGLPGNPFASELVRLEGGTVQAPAWLQAIASVMSVVLLAGGIGLIFALALRRHTRQDEEGVEETRELVWSVDVMREEWRALFQNLRGRLRKLRDAQPRFLSLGGLDPERRAIRQLYQQLLALAEDQGLPRPPHATPLEYASILEDCYATSEWQTISQAYTRARYTLGPLPPGLAAQMRASWLRLSHQWQREQGSGGTPPLNERES
jgi:hypothetical protein